MFYVLYFIFYLFFILAALSWGRTLSQSSTDSSRAAQSANDILSLWTNLEKGPCRPDYGGNPEEKEDEEGNPLILYINWHNAQPHSELCIHGTDSKHHVRGFEN